MAFHIFVLATVADDPHFRVITNRTTWHLKHIAQTTWSTILLSAYHCVNYCTVFLNLMLVQLLKPRIAERPIMLFEGKSTRLERHLCWGLPFFWQQNIALLSRGDEQTKFCSSLEKIWHQGRNSPDKRNLMFRFQMPMSFSMTRKAVIIVRQIEKLYRDWSSTTAPLGCWLLQIGHCRHVPIQTSFGQVESHLTKGLE